MKYSERDRKRVEDFMISYFKEPLGVVVAYDALSAMWTATNGRLVVRVDEQFVRIRLGLRSAQASIAARMWRWLTRRINVLDYAMAAAVGMLILCYVLMIYITWRQC